VDEELRWEIQLNSPDFSYVGLHVPVTNYHATGAYRGVEVKIQKLLDLGTGWMLKSARLA
jgi:hypothetical protein